MSQDQIDVDAIRERVEKRLKARTGFYIHFAVYVAVIVTLWVLYFLRTPGMSMTPPPPLVVMFGWGIGIVAHGVSVFASQRMDDVREREVERAIERERMRYAQAEKPKRDERAMRLSDEGELIPEEEWESEEKVKARRR